MSSDKALTRTRCVAHTKTGAPCLYRAKPNTRFCGVHSRAGAGAFDPDQIPANVPLPDSVDHKDSDDVNNLNNVVSDHKSGTEHKESANQCTSITHGLTRCYKRGKIHDLDGRGKVYNSDGTERILCLDHYRFEINHATIPYFLELEAKKIASLKRLKNESNINRQTERIAECHICHVKREMVVLACCANEICTPCIQKIIRVKIDTRLFKCKICKKKNHYMTDEKQNWNVMVKAETVMNEINHKIADISGIHKIILSYM
jgi:hypothetical protein